MCRCELWKKDNSLNKCKRTVFEIVTFFEIDNNKLTRYKNVLFTECCKAYKKLLQHTVLEDVTRTDLYSCSLP